ncbi:ABC transporter ATP-binding protein [Aquimonas sp.]|jgi:ABC-2 type transport system ATP-binding protein|uniref:ABC transporter ATP-binding protein n=1 Tax=Aquimonas sp. TaxID=1872588 RepID=UPI0037BE5603
MSSTASPVARLTDARKHYGPIVALDCVDLEVRAGEVFAVLGPNGAGKSTALGLLTGRLAPDSGEAQVFGLDPRDAAARRRIGVMQQEARLPETLRVAELVTLWSGYYPDPRPVAETLSLAGLVDLAKRPYQALSGGQQRRVQFALAICGRAPLLFVDEPTTGLDIEARRAFWDVLRGLREAGTSLVLTTHYLEEADALADRIVLINGGRVLAEDTPAGLKARSTGSRVAARTSLAAAELASWDEVDAVESAGGRLLMRSRTPDALVRRLLAADPTCADLEVSALSLEEAFVALTRADVAR